MRDLRGSFSVIVFLATAIGTAQDLRFQHLTTDDGLSDNAITCVYEDHAGFIWVGTEHGLNRYDGNAVWQPRDGTLRAEWITGILEDGADAFWITTREHGLIRYDKRTEAVRRFRKAENDTHRLASEQLNGLYELNDTTILLASREVSLIFLDKRSLVFTYWADSTSLDPLRAESAPPAHHGWCHAIVPLDEDRLWLGFLNFNQSWVVDRHTLRTSTLLMVQRAGSETQTCAALQSGILYTGGWQNGLDAIPLGRNAPAHIQASSPLQVRATPDEVVSIVPWSKGRLLMSIRQHGLLLFDPAAGSFTRFAHATNDFSSIASDQVGCLFVDRSATVWVGTSNGLDRFVPDVWRMQVRSLFGNSDIDHQDVHFHAIEAQPDGGARLFTSDGIITTDARGSAVRHMAVRANGMDLQPTVIGRDHDGALLLGTEYGILRYHDLNDPDPQEFSINDGGGHVYRPGSMFQVRGISPDTVEGRPVFVIGTLGFGVHVVDAATARVLGWGMPTSANDAQAFSLVNSMVRDASGTYWYGTSGGVLRWDTHMPMIRLTLKSAEANGSIDVPMKGEDVRQLILLNDTVWGVARNGTLFSITNGTVVRHVPTGGSRNTMLGLTADRRGTIWIATEDGLLRFDPRSAVFTHVPVNDGHAFRKLTRAIATLTDGRIAICANNAVITFDPDAFDQLPELPNAYITSILSAGKPVMIENGSAELSYRASVIDIAISALSPQQPQPLKFDYRLDGVETEWRTITAREAIRYAGVPVGSHDLLVRVRDAYGRAGSVQRLLTIIVIGPLWQQWWFYAIALLLIAAGLYALYRYRLAQALKLQAVRNRIASDLHDEVGSSLSSITIGSQLAAKLSSAENEQVKHLMARIGETSSESLRSMSDIVWAIDPKNDQGNALVKRMRRIANELLESKGVEVSFSVTGGVEELKLPMNARKDLLLIYKEAVHNASKYAEARSVMIDLSRANGWLTMRVKDDGKGFDPALHPDGHGLGSMQRRGAALGTRVIIESAAGEGTLVSIRVDLTRIRD
ncbi:MAG: ATP-binding protein [Flavobacteriales bacterium]|nr:ATP-binding protein [Flavobacteriales bacterium]